MINHFIGVGHLTSSMELKYTNSGSAFGKFSICINDSYKKDNEWINTPHFFNCVMWGKYAESMSKHMTKGRLIGVEGKLTQNPWTDKNDIKHNDYSIVIDNIHLFPKPGACSSTGNTQPENEAPQGEEKSPPGEEGIPF